MDLNLANPFEGFRRHVDLIQHKKEIENSFDSVFKFLEENGIKLDKKIIEKTFYDLYRDEMGYRFNRRNHKITHLISKFVQVMLLFSENKITKKMLDIQNQKLGYIYKVNNSYLEN